MADHKPPFTYLNTAACGLIPEQFIPPTAQFYQDMSQIGSIRVFDWMENEQQAIHQLTAKFLGAATENIALIPSFSFGINAVVQSLRGTERILLYEKDYPSLTHPFRVNNFDITWIPAGDGFHVDLQLMEKMFRDHKIDLFAVSHVQWLTGTQVRLKEMIKLCHQYGVPVIVDTTQSLGAMPVSVKDYGMDVMIASNYKWMNAGFATGILYINDSFIKRYPPKMGGIHSYEQDGKEFKRVASILDYEPGHLGIEGLFILSEAIKDKNQRGLNEIETHNRELTQRFLEGCKSLPIGLVGPYEMEDRCSIVVLKDENGLGDWLLKNKMIVTLRNETIRLGFHYYNTKDQVDALLDCIGHLS